MWQEWALHGERLTLGKYCGKLTSQPHWSLMFLGSELYKLEASKQARKDSRINVNKFLHRNCKFLLDTL